MPRLRDSSLPKIRLLSAGLLVRFAAALLFFATPVCASLASLPDTLRVVTKFEYDAVNLQPRVVEVVTSDGSVRRTETAYAYQSGSGFECRIGGLDMTWFGTHQLAAVCATAVFDGELNGDVPEWHEDPLSCSRTRYRAHGGAGVPDRQYAGCDTQQVSEEVETLHFVSYDAFGRVEEFDGASDVRVTISFDGRHVSGISREFRHHYTDTHYYDIVLDQTFDYDDFGRLVLATDENGTRLHYTYDPLGRLTHIARSYDDGPLVVNDLLAQHDYYLSVLHGANGDFDALRPNFVRTELFASTGADTEVSTVYFDGLGRELQTQQQMTSETVSVSIPEYDPLGRPHRQWLPVEMPMSAGVPGGHGFIGINAVREAAADWYEGKPGNLPDPVAEPSTVPYTRLSYESNPLSRETRVRASGTGVDGTYSGSGHPVDYAYGVARPAWGGQPKADAMTYTEALDQDGRWTRTYTDGLGRERFVSRGQDQTQETLTELVYDAADRLIEVRPPHFFDAPQGSQDIDWITAYAYDTRGLMTAKTTPDTRNTAGNGPGTHRYAYDDFGRMRYSQDPEQRARGEVAFVLYDALGRAHTQGVGRPLACDDDYSGSGATETCWGALDPHIGARMNDAKDPECDDGGLPCHWEWRSFNRRAQYLYDDPTHDDGEQTPTPLVETGPFNGSEAFVYANTAGRLVAVAYRTEGLWQANGTWQTSLFAYDADGNVAERWTRVLTSSHTPWDRFTYQYDLQGRPVRDSVRVGDYSLTHTYVYDKRGLLAEVRVSSGDGDLGVPDITMTYDVSGAVTGRQLGINAANLGYIYDVAGRLVEIDETDHFTARYSYSAGGLIDRIDTRSPRAVTGCGNPAGPACAEHWRYDFDYDRLARLTDANYFYDLGTGFEPQSFFDMATGYDRQGNILGLWRTAPNAEFGAPRSIDELQYEYQPRTNRLIAVTDAVETDLTWDAKPTTFVYDRTGNMISMVEALGGSETRMTEVLALDERHLPERLRITQGSEQLGVRYAYDLGGQRIKKVTFTDGSLPRPDPHFSVERYVRDGMRLVGVFDGEGNLKWWNMGGAAGLIGRIDPEMEQVLDDQLAIDTAITEIEARSHDNLVAALEAVGLISKDAWVVANEAHPGVEAIALNAVEEAVQAAMGPGAETDPAGSAHYALTVDDTIDEIMAALEAKSFNPDLGRDAGPLAASANAELVGAAVAAAYYPEPTGNYDRRYYIADHLGSIRVVVNEQGVPIEARDHYPYGLMMPGRTFTAGQETREGYTGHELDQETGMYYAGARYYMPALGRWTAVDPLAELFRGWSPYHYAANNPILVIDPDGENWYCIQDDNGECSEYVWDASIESQEDLDDGFLFLGINYVIEFDDGYDFMLLDNGDLDIIVGMVPDFTDSDFLERAARQGGGYVLGALVSSGGAFQALQEGRNQILLRDVIAHEQARGEAALELFMAGSGVALARAAPALFQRLVNATGGREQWIRIGNSHSISGGFPTVALRWGSNPHYAARIGNETLRRWNQSLRQVRLPGNNWRVRDPGHLHLRRR